MKRIFLSTISLALVFSLATPSVSAQNAGQSTPSVTELAEHVPGELLVRFSPAMNSVQVANKMQEMNVAHKREIQGIGVHLVKLPPGLSVEQAMDRFNHLPGVEFAEPNFILHIAETRQTEIIDQWGLTRIHTQEAWSTLNENERNEVLLATVDTGIQKEESDLSSRIWYFPGEIPGNGIDDNNNGYVDDTWGWDFANNDNDPTDDHMHGTAVTSVMVAAQDGAGMVGICPWCRVMAVKVLDSQGSGSLDVVASGIVYAAQSGARVINLSLGAAIGAQTLEDAVNFAWNQGAVVVAAAGNDGNSTILYPAGYANAIAVASTNSADQHSCFSNYQAGYVSVAAPGEAIYVIDINDSTTGYNYYSGTSLSTPHVSALAGLILGKDPNLSNAQVRSIIENSAVDLGSAGPDAAFGHGRIDAYRAIIGDTSQTTPPDSLSSASDTATGYAHARKLVRDSTGKLHLIWHTQGSLYRIRYATSIDNGNSWVLQPDVFSSPYETYHPALAADATYLYVAIPSRPNAGSPYRILFTRKPLTGGAWSPAMSLMGGTYNTVRPDIYVDPTNGRLHVIASSLDDAAYLYYRASNTQGATWGNLSQFNPSGSTSNTRYASIHANGDNIYIATRTVENLLFYTYYYLYTARSTNAGLTWIDQTQISSYLAFTTGEYGVSLAGVGDRLYMGYEVGSNLYFRRYDGAGWSDYLQLEAGDLDHVYKWPTITQANDGQAWMVFQVNGQLYMRHYDGVSWAAKEYVSQGSYANLKRGTGGGLVEWMSTICNGSPFDLNYGSLNIGSPPPTNTPTVTPTNTPLATATRTPLATTTNTSLPQATKTRLSTATNTPLLTATNARTPTATRTSLPPATNTPLPTATNTPLPGTSTGFLSPSANGAVTSKAGDNNGYETSPANAYANDTLVATDLDSGSNTNTSCTDSGKDKHQYYNYNFSFTGTPVITGIELRLDARSDSTSGAPRICVQLSSDGGVTWTTARQTSTLTTTEATYILGSTSDTWGRTWSSGNFSNANFRVRVTNVASDTSRDFYLDYIAINVTYRP